MRLTATAIALLLTASADAQDGPRPASSGGKEQLICKREVPVGSLIASRKVCLTKTQWRKRSDDGNATARGLIERGAGACGQNGGVCPS